MQGRIAALVGDYYHRPEPMVEALGAVAESLDLRLESFTDPLALSWDALGSYRALVVARENRIAPNESAAVWVTPRHETALARFVQGGGALLGLHSGLASYPSEGPWSDSIRGAFQFHPSEHPRYKVLARHPSHPILEGFDPFEMQDEMYFVRVDSARTTCLLEVASPDYGTSCAAWAHGIGSGRVFCLTPAHTIPALRDPSFRGLLTRGLRWALGAG